jgi:CRISPR type III-B/RAMP module RAMP protein Cmr6
MPFIPTPDYIAVVAKKGANFSLQFNKWVYFGGSFGEPRELKEKKADEFVRLRKEYDDKKAGLETIAETRFRRTMAILSALRNKGSSVGILKCKVSDALVCGIGDEHPLENSLRFDHCTGLPYIPSSSIKGVARYAAQYDEDRDEPVPSKEKDIFGAEDAIGAVQFWDGFPSKVPGLKIDIMNNHFQDYYGDDGGTIAPSDDMNPNPVFFLVVDSGSEFYFPIVAKSEGDLQRTSGFLQQALSEWGVGAKTSVGYGMFHDFKIEFIEPAKLTAVQEQKTACQKALEALQTKTSPENFDHFIESLTTEDEDWLKAQDIFAVRNFNKGFADRLLEGASIPDPIRRILAQAFLDHIDLKEAKKKAAKGDRKDLDRHEKLQAIVGGG